MSFSYINVIIDTHQCRSGTGSPENLAVITMFSPRETVTGRQEFFLSMIGLT